MPRDRWGVCRASEDGVGHVDAGIRDPLDPALGFVRARTPVSRLAAARRLPDCHAPRQGNDPAVASSGDNDPDFTDEFCGFLQRCVANVDAAELLLLLHQEPDRWWEARELSAQLAPGATLSEADVQRYADAFQQCAVVVRDAERRIQYRRAPAHDEHLERLARLYVERPVTLFRIIYALRDTKINTFAEAFKLRR